MVVDVRSMIESLPSELKADINGNFLTVIAEQPNEILKCAMYLFLGYLDGASQFAQSCGGGGGDNSLPWGRKEDEDDRRVAYRCMMQAHNPPKISQSKFSGMRMQPVGLFDSLTVEPKGHRQSRPILNVCIAKGMPMMVHARARLPVK